MRRANASQVDVTTPPAIEQIRAACDALTGEIMQRPPNFSAVKVGGKRAYTVARTGGDVKIEPKRVTIHEITIDDYHWPELTLTIRCGKGTYIRSIARDLGNALQTGGTLLNLRRSRIGPYTARRRDRRRTRSRRPSRSNSSIAVRRADRRRGQDGRQNEKKAPLEDRSSRRFSYGYLVTTSSQSPSSP